MSKPSTAPPKSVPEYDGHPSRRIRAIRRGNNVYDVVEEIFAGPPTKTTVIKAGTARIDAEYRVRLYLEEQLGANRFGDSGL